MKKYIFNIILLGIISLVTFSCKQEVKEANDLQSLKAKYNINFVEFKDCNEFADAYSEAMNILFDKLENSDLTLLEADREFRELNVIISFLFDLQMEEYSNDCPKFDSINEKLAVRYQNINMKFMQANQAMMQNQSDEIEEEEILLEDEE